MEKKITVVATVYIVIGILFAIAYALYYHWSLFGFLSPGFFIVVFTWPFQAIGFIQDLLYYGLAGKPVGV